MEINGLPLHPLVVHAAVVFGPLAAVTALAYVVLPGWRDRLRWPLLALALVATGAVVLAYLSGDSFREANAFFNAPGPVSDRIDEHEELAELLLWATLGFGLVATLTALLHPRSGALRLVLNLVLAVAALGVLVLVALTGDAGAQAVWDGFNG